MENSIKCPFCDPAIHSAMYDEIADFLAIYNIAPILPGHSLVIPRKHISGLLELSPGEISAFFNFATRIVRILSKAFHTDAFDWSIQEKPEAGQTIDHLHLHIVPRMKNDFPSPGDWYPFIQHNDSQIMDSFDRPQINQQAMQQIVRELKYIAASL
jgi:bis(5'-adenosyl)-triphosphatase